MKGVLFNVVEAVITELDGADAWDDVLEASGVVGAYTSLGDYPDGELSVLVVATAARFELSADAVLVIAGRQGFRHLVAHHPELVSQYRDVLGLAADLDDVIHPEVRKLYPDATPPTFRSVRRDHGIDLEYRSHRRLCRLVEGLLLGAGDYYGQAVTVTHGACMRSGASACLIGLDVAHPVPR